jgi:VIT1/CCC1 family predicted Fe2+/Mn2+ transporter
MHSLTNRAHVFAAEEHRDHLAYRALAHHETNPLLRDALLRLAAIEERECILWRTLAQEEEPALRVPHAYFLRLLRTLFGITFIARYLVREEHEAREHYESFLRDATDPKTKEILRAIGDAMTEEEQVIAGIKEEKVEYTSSIILGLNDGLIELTGALVGFSFALSNQVFVALTGSITGIAASLSMSASAYMQASHEVGGKDPYRVALYTGLAYFIVVCLLVAPFLILPSSLLALSAMAVMILCIVSLISYYTAVIFERSFRSQFFQMLSLSIGVAGISFLVGTLLRGMTGLSID